VALAAEKTAGKLLRFVAFDVAAEKAGVSTFLQRGSITMAPSALMGALAYWVVLILVIVSAVDYLGLTVVAESLDKLVAYIPNVIGSVLILVIGLFLAGVSAGVVRTAASNAGIMHASLVGLVARWRSSLSPSSWHSRNWASQPPSWPPLSTSSSEPFASASRWPSA
jgi:hypothetical protein